MISTKLTYRFTFFFAVLVGLLLGSCSGKQTLRGVFQKQTPHEKYEQALRAANLHNTGLGQDWIEAGRKALRDSIAISKLPFKETGYFKSDRPTATGYRFKAPRGQVVDIAVETKARQSVNLFLDLFELSPDPTREPKHVASADSAAARLEYRIDNDRTHLLRLQPELLRSGQYTLTIVSRPTLAFPVQGKDSKAILSGFGVDRDRGARRHEGVDIFAQRGTPVVAAAEGLVTRVKETPRGGKVVWLTDPKNRQNLYYAHLDAQLVQPGQHVRVGDTLGLVGNTGNAITTAPHLHFGIYKYGEGAIDPYMHVHQPSTTPPQIKADLSKLGNWGRVKNKNVNLRVAPDNKALVLASLPLHTPLQVFGGTDTWFRVRTPDGVDGYVSAALVEPLDKPIRHEQLQPHWPLLEEADLAAAPLDSSTLNHRVPVLATYKSFLLVQNEAGELGWLLKNE
jgi:murein DD-endopeptidase MepM/ murein hydrolase activator NlpD